MFSAIVLLALIPAALSSCCPYYESSTCTDWALRYNLPCSLRSKTITVYVEKDVAPFVSVVGSGVPFGLDIELLNYFRYVYHIDFQFEYVTFQDLVSSVKNNTNSIAISTITITQDRIKLVDFAKYFQSRSTFLVRTDYKGTITGLASLCGQKVGVLTGSTQEEDVDDQNDECEAGNDITVDSAPTQTELIQSLLNGDIDVYVTDEVTATYTVSQSGGQLNTTGGTYDVQPYGIACNKDNRDLCCAFVNAINSFIQSGFYTELLKKYSFKFAENGICPSRINLSGPTCEPACRVGRGTCRALAKQ